MKNFIKPMEHGNMSCSACYIILFLGWILGPISILSMGLGEDPPFDAVVPILAEMAAVAAVLILAGLLASRGSRLRFHAFQAVLLHGVGILAMTFVGLTTRSNAEQVGGAGALVVVLGAVVVILLLIALFGFAVVYMAIKAGSGRDVHLPLIGPLARSLAEGSSSERKKFNFTGNRLSSLLFSLVVITGVIVGTSYWLYKVPQEAPAAPSVTATEDFFKFPWGGSEEEIRKMAEERQFRLRPGGAMQWGGSYDTKFAGCPAMFKFEFLSRNVFKGSFYEGKIHMEGNNCPVEKLYQQFHKELTERYGPVPYDIWEIKSPDGQLVEIHLTLSLAKRAEMLELKVRNVSVQRRFNNLEKPMPEGKPISTN